MTISKSMLGLAAVLLFWGSASAEQLSVIDAREKLARAKTSSQAKSAAKSLGASLATQADGSDTKAPVVDNLSISGSVNVQKILSSAVLTVRARDDLSGITGGYLFFRSPNGRASAAVYMSTPMPETRTILQADMRVQTNSYSREVFSPWAEPGDWMVTFGYIGDIAGNGIWLDPAMLANKGWSDRVTVLNSKPDTLPPVMNSGKLGATEGSLASNAPGTSMPSYVSATLNFTDMGEVVDVSGVSSASMKLCRVNATNCFDTTKYITLSGYNPIHGKKSLAIKVASQLKRGDPLQANELGDYRVVEVSVGDHAGNVTTLTSTVIGGTTDFTTLFDNTIFTLKP